MRLFKIDFIVPLVNEEAHAEAMDLLARLQGVDLPDSPSKEEFADEVRRFLVEYPHVLRVDGETWHSVDLTRSDVYELVIDFSRFNLADYALECLADIQHEVEYREGIAELFRTCDDINLHVRKIEGR